MEPSQLLKIRLSNQLLSKSIIKSPTELVRWLGAIQSQDFSGAKWGISQRTNFISDQNIEKEFNEGKFLRTHVMRPTWHFVHSEDIAWMLDLTGSRVKSAMRSYNKSLGLSDEVFEKSKKIISKSLKNKNYLNREEMGILLKNNGINWKGNGLAHIVMWLEVDKLICSGPIINKKQTYSIFEERVPYSKAFSKEESIYKLVKNYFQSHGPAQIKDFVWWSGLTTTEAKFGLEACQTLLRKYIINNKTYYYFENRIFENSDIYLLPNYDEYTIAYRDREDLFINVNHSKLDERQNALFNNSVIIDGKVEGLWRRTLKPKEVNIELRLFRNLNLDEKKELKNILQKYSDFIGLPHKATFI